jgi:hypothetical protein
LFTVGAGTLAAGSFKQFDFATNSWGGNLSIVNLPATLATDGRMAYPYVLDNPFATGTATAGGATTLTNGLKAWTTNQWTNYQVRITGGTGIGQVRTIASNTGTVLTVSASWTTNPDVTSTYEIEGNQDHIYYLGNNAVAMYRYTISTNAWALLAPGVARAAAPGLGMSACIPLNIDRAGWDTENTISNGKFIYSYRGGASGVLDRYDIAANSWSAVTTINTETFTTGSSYDLSDRYIYIRKDATNRFFKMSITGNYIEPLSTDFFPDGAALIGNKMWVQTLPNSTNSVKWLYSLQNTGTVLRRLPLYQD